MDKAEEIKETGCCPIFKPETWEGLELNWDKKKFVKDRIRSCFHIPLNFGKVITRNIEAIEKNGLKIPDNLILSDENSLWGSDLYLSVDDELPNGNNVTLSGTFLTKVFEGSFQDAGNWAKEMNLFVLSKGYKTKKLYYWYTTCPKCAKVYGKNYVVVFAELD